jgi:hypothetical protein
VPAPRRTILIAGRTFGRWEALAVVFLAAATVSLLVGLTIHHQPDRPSGLAATAPIGPTSTSTAVSTPGAVSQASRAIATHSQVPSSSRATSSIPKTTSRHTSRPVPSKSSATTAPTPTPSPSAVRASLPPADGTAVMRTSDPVHINVPAIGVSSDMPQLGLNPDGTVEVPPLAANSQAGWYKFSATPGAVGSAVVLGHIDSAAYGPGVFYHLGDLQPGDEIDISRADGSTAVFRTDRVAEYPKTAFPTDLVYSPTTYSSLRLITCGGAFDSQDRNYLDNIIVFATLTGTRS